MIKTPKKYLGLLLLAGLVFATLGTSPVVKSGHGNNDALSDSVPETVRAVVDKSHGSKSTTVFYPHVDFVIEDVTYSGNPFDVIVNITFTHTDTGKNIRSLAFYDGDWDGRTGVSTQDSWVIRFTGIKAGEWTFTTFSSNSNLNGHTGTIIVVRQDQGDEILGRGFLTGENNRWIWSESKKGFVPVTMYGHSPLAFFTDEAVNEAKIKNSVSKVFDDHGFNSYSTTLFMGWFDIEKSPYHGTPDIVRESRSRPDSRFSKFVKKLMTRFKGWFNTEKSPHHNATASIGKDQSNPDIKTFEVLETLISEFYKTEGALHILWWHHMEGNPGNLKGGTNGPVDERLQRYVAARIGMLPGVVHSYGIDMHNYVNEQQLFDWIENMESFTDYPIVLGARAHHADVDFEIGIKPDGTAGKHPSNSGYIGWSDAGFKEAPHYLYHRFFDSVQYVRFNNVEVPVYSEERFRADYNPWSGGLGWGSTLEFTRMEILMSMWHQYMAGGLGTIIGRGYPELEPPQLFNGLESNDFEKQWRKRFVFLRDFWKKRWNKDLFVSNWFTDGKGLESPNRQNFIVFKHSTDTIYVNLEDMNGMQPYVLYDVLSGKPVDSGTLLPGKFFFDLSDNGLSAYVLSVGDFAEFGDIITWQAPLPYIRISSNPDLHTYPVSHLVFDMSFINAPDFWNSLREDGGNVQVYDHRGSRVPAFMLDFNKKAQKGRLYFKASTTTKVNNEFYIHIADKHAVAPETDSRYGRNSIFDSRYLGVWDFHLKKDGADNEFMDLTGQNHLKSSDPKGKTTPVLVDGLFGKGLYFDGTGGRIGKHLENKKPRLFLSSISALFKPDAPVQSGKAAIAALGNKNLTGAGVAGIAFNSDHTIAFEFSLDGAEKKSDLTRVFSDAIPLNEYSYAAGRYFGKRRAQLYVNGMEKTREAEKNFQHPLPAFEEIFIGGMPGSESRGFAGVTDYVSIMSDIVVRQWFETEYHNQINNSVFWSIGESMSTDQLPGPSEKL